jgi:hypothetical protein
MASLQSSSAKSSGSISSGLAGPALPPSSAGATVHDEFWPLLQLFAISPNPGTFVLNF